MKEKMDLSWDRFVIHPDFKLSWPQANNIALMKLEKSARTNLGVQVACLPLPNFALNTAYVVGR